MQELKLNDLLRYAFSGAIAMFTFVILYNPNIEPIKGNIALGDTAVLGVLALLIGSLIYTFYRSVIYPLLYRFILIVLVLQKKYVFELGMLIPFRPTELELDLDTKRWKVRKDKESIINNLIEWSSQIHFLYTTNIAMISAFISATYLQNYSRLQIETDIPEKFWFVNIVIFSSALVTHWRALIYEHKIFCDITNKNTLANNPSMKCYGDK
ncbi:MAG: hypothetical protein EPO24_05535 [Bacteroidetes bacterium]|nr:MAG: hypothetical protein EPO24_05535 [Bacteroidota bacterium]